MDDLLFSNRNRLYGAYRLRRQHPFVLFWSALGVLFAFCLVMGWIRFHHADRPDSSEETWYFFDLGAAEGLSQPVKKLPPPPSGGGFTPALFPLIADSVPEADTLLNPANGNPGDSAGEGNGNHNGDGDGQIYFSAQQPPAFPGGENERIRFLQQNIIYPPAARQKKVKGTVYISFVVEKDGSVSQVKLLRGIGYGCDEEALRVVNSMPHWIPGKQNGLPVRVQMVIPLVFSIN